MNPMEKANSKPVPPEPAAEIEITQLLRRVSSGDKSAEAELYTCIHSELRRLASAKLRHERPGHTLQATALVNEAYLKLVHNQSVEWSGRNHFLALAAQSMRRILADYARSRNAAKRGSGVAAVPIDQVEKLLITVGQSGLVAELDCALVRLAQFRPDWARIVEMRFFGGLTEDEIADMEGISARTIKRKWLKARAWLQGEMEE
jgi:RNA polymerase sigma factor (TIGR02999 family)